MKRVGALIVILLAVLTGSAGCSTAVACASWVSFPSDEERADASDAVIVVDEVVADGSMSILGYAAHAYQVQVAATEKGDLVVGEMVRVGSTADACAAEPYDNEGAGDPLLGELPLRLYLTHGETGWRTITPFDGVRAAK